MDYRQETIKPYDGDESKREQVEQMFDNIAPSYDSLNHKLSLNIDKRWRKKAIESLKPFNPKNILDVATGTGDFAIQAVNMLSPTHLLGVDISDEMMRIGKEKVLKNKMDDIIDFQHEDCLSLSFEDESFDAVTSAFGIRNFSDLEGGLREMYRVLKQGGHLCVIELTTPKSFPMKQLFSIYSHTILPFIGKIISKDKNAYTYLTNTIEAFPQGEKMMDLLYQIGFANASFKRLTFGICTLYNAEK